jgi:hypothetical protein
VAVGLAFAAGGPDLGIPLALAIGIQNAPEGFAAAAPLLATGTSARAAAGIADELIAESHSGSHEQEATLALIVGFG